ncbi:hypothetical protein C0991_004785 [Blastosporella zonata]|nr:hypothetical protein C0991_004785 [Blastosporella zonata]
MQEMPLFEEDNKDFVTSPVRKPFASSKSLGKRKAGTILGRVNMDSGPSNTRPSKVSKMGSGQPSTKQAKAPVDILEAHPTCQQCTTAKVAKRCWYPQARLPCCHCLNSGIACKNLAGDTACDAQCWAHVGRRKEKKVAAPAARAVRAPADNEEGPAAGPSNTTLAVLPALGGEDNEVEILGEGVLAEGILGEPKLEERDNGALVAPEESEGSGESESAKLVWWLADELATKFEQVTRRMGELRELEAAMPDYAAACKPECADLRFKLLRMQTVLGKTRWLQGTLVESRREAEEALWEILAFD